MAEHDAIPDDPLDSAAADELVSATIDSEEPLARPPDHGRIPPAEDTPAAPASALPDTHPDRRAERSPEYFAARNLTELSKTVSPAKAATATRSKRQELPTVDREGYAIGPIFAQGGIGRILEARDRHLGRRVALKELLIRSRHAEERFVREALITARLQHPGVVPIYAAGRWPSGEPFYAMKMVSGQPLAEALEEASTYAERLVLLAQVLAVAETMAYAHSRRIIHRDLKPENILLGSYGETVVIDWGLAKELDDDDDTSSPLADSALRANLRPSSSSDGPQLPGKDLTMVGAVVGTPAYMPPEQAYGDPVDQRADVYALGAILYHVVAGQPPYDGSTAVSILMQVTSAPPPPIEEVEPAVPPELAAIISTAMAYAPPDRYPDAEALAEDLRRFQTGQLVAAHNYSTRERLRRVVRRYRAPIAVAAASLVILAIISVISLYRVIAERDEAQLARGQAEQARDAAAHAREESDSARLVAEQQADALALEQARIAAREQPSRTIELLADLHDKSEWQRLRLIAADAAARGLGVNLIGHSAGVSRLAFTPDSRTLASAADDCAITVWELDSGEGKRLFGHTDEVWRIEFNHDGSLLASASRDRTIGLWAPQTGERIALLEGHEAAVRTLAFTKDGDHLLSGGDDDRLLLWDLADRSYELLEECLAGSMFTDGARVGCIASDRIGVTVIDLRTRERYHLAAKDPLAPTGDFAPDTDELAVGTMNGNLLRWRWADGPQRYDRLEGGGYMLRAVRYSPDGEQLIGAGADREVWVWDRASGERVRTFTGHGGRIARLDVSSDSRLIASSSGESGPRLWNTADGNGTMLTGLAAGTSAIRFAPDGSTLAAASTGGEVRLWHRDSLNHGLGRRISAQETIAVDPVRPRLGTVDRAGVLRVWDLDTEQVLFAARPPQEIEQIAFFPNTGAIARLSLDGLLTVASADGEVLRQFPAAGGRIFGKMLIASNGRHAVVSREDGALLHWDLERDEMLLLRGHTGIVHGLSFSPDNRWLATGGHDRSVRLWDLENGTSEIVDRHALGIATVAFSVDGRYIFSGGEAHELQIYDRITETMTAHSVGGYVLGALTPFADGRRLAMIRGDDQILIWDIPTRRIVQQLSGHQVAVRTIVIEHAGQTLLSLGVNGKVRLWDIQTGESRVLETIGAHSSLAYWHPSRRAIVHSLGNEVGIWTDDVPYTQVGFLQWLRDTRAGLTRSLDDLKPPPRCRSLDPH